MIEVNATLFTLLVEGFALACILLLTVTIVRTRRRGRDRRALKALVADINSEAAGRLERTQALLDNRDSAKALSRHERGVCQAFIGAYDRRAAESVTGIYAALKTLVDAYQLELERLAGRVATPSAENGGSAAKDAVIVKLKNDYEQIARELEITKRTMDKMLREYSSMFAGGSGEAQDTELEAVEIIQMLDASEEGAEPAEATCSDAHADAAQDEAGAGTVDAASTEIDDDRERGEQAPEEQRPTTRAAG